jgi:hypothetical protein
MVYLSVICHLAPEKTEAYNKNSVTVALTQNNNRGPKYTLLKVDRSDHLRFRPISAHYL